MENRSFDHYLGWLADRRAYMDAGRARYGPTFRVDGKQHLTLHRRRRHERRHDVPPRCARGEPTVSGLRPPDPGHGWNTGRVERDDGFLGDRDAATTRSRSATTRATTCPCTTQLARRFTVADHSFSSLLGRDVPEPPVHARRDSRTASRRTRPARRRDLRRRDDLGPARRRPACRAALLLRRPPVPRALGRPRLRPDLTHRRLLRRRREAGTLPNVVVWSTPGSRPGPHRRPPARRHPRWRSVHPRACSARSRSRRSGTRGLFVLTYDEWGGFFDHVAPPVVADDRVSDIDDDNFGQTGLPRADDPRVTLRAARVRRQPDLRPHVDPAVHRVALPRRAARRTWRRRTGVGTSPNATATPTTSVRRWSGRPTPTLDIDLDAPIAAPSAACDQPERPSAPDELSPADVPQTANFREKVNAHFPPAQARPWQ